MNYKLAKRLQKAGFPQDTLLSYHCSKNLGDKKVKWIIQSTNYPFIIGDFPNLKGKTIIACPNLEELIKECEPRFLALTRYEKIDGTVEWGACVTNYEAMEKTPTEALVNLYIKLNEK